MATGAKVVDAELAGRRRHGGRLHDAAVDFELDRDVVHRRPAIADAGGNRHPLGRSDRRQPLHRQRGH
jgi:hypothetical protein